MATLAVLVHYDPHGHIANHVRHTIDQLRPTADRLVLVTTSPLTPTGKARLDTVDDVIERDNTGYDFSSWRTGLLATPDWPDHDRIILANDSIIGPLTPTTNLLAHMTSSGTDAYGITISPQGGEHVQSYFAVYGPRVLRDPAFRQFWHGMTPVSARDQVIERYELGLGAVIADAGLTVGSYFTATPHEQRLMAARMASFHRPSGVKQLAAAAAYALQPIRKVVESPILGLWDRVFDQARLPAVKVSLFSRNPYQIDRDAVLARLTAEHPEAFEGFPDYLRRIGVTW